jgi:Raf kinase inhibitor-like YbhB/YbcL family protein
MDNPRPDTYSLQSCFQAPVQDSHSHYLTPGSLERLLFIPAIEKEVEVLKTLNLASPAFKEGERIPDEFTCSGENISPPLTWSGVPDQASSLVLILEDPDAPSGTWAHWILFNLDSSLRELPEGIRGQGRTGLVGLNDFHELGYGGPCPPRGKPHRYFFHLYALDTRLDLGEGATRRQVKQAMQEHILAEGQLMGIFSR